MQDYSNLDQSQLNMLLGGSTSEPLIPESVVTFLIVCFVILNLLTIAFLIFWIMGMVRRWKVQTAVLNMQKELVEIKQLLKATNTTPNPPVQHQPVQPDRSTTTNTEATTAEPATNQQQ